MQLTNACVKAWLDQQSLCSSNFYHLLFRHDIKHLAIVLIFNFSFSIKHLFRLTVRYCANIAFVPLGFKNIAHQRLQF